MVTCHQPTVSVLTGVGLSFNVYGGNMQIKYRRRHFVVRDGWHQKEREKSQGGRGVISHFLPFVFRGFFYFFGGSPPIAKKMPKNIINMSACVYQYTVRARAEEDIDE